MPEASLARKSLTALDVLVYTHNVCYGKIFTKVELNIIFFKKSRPVVDKIGDTPKISGRRLKHRAFELV